MEAAPNIAPYEPRVHNVVLFLRANRATRVQYAGPLAREEAIAKAKHLRTLFPDSLVGVDVTLAPLPVQAEEQARALAARSGPVDCPDCGSDDLVIERPFFSYVACACGYRGPDTLEGTAEAVRLHNALAASRGPESLGEGSAPAPSSVAPRPARGGRARVASARAL